MTDPFMFIFIMTSIISFVLVAVITILFIHGWNREKQIEAEIQRTSERDGIKRWKGSAENSGLKSTLLDGSYVDTMLTYPDQVILGRARFRFNNADILFDFAACPFSRYPNLKLVVDSRKNNPLGRSLMDLTTSKSALRFVELEGNFPNSFKVFIEEGEQAEALSVLNPASMSELLKYFEAYDMEICNDRLYLYQIGNMNFFTESMRKQTYETIRRLASILQ